MANIILKMAVEKQMNRGSILNQYIDDYNRFCVLSGVSPAWSGMRLN